MAEFLVITETPGKRAGLSDALWRAGFRGYKVLAIPGHITTHPSQLKGLGAASRFLTSIYSIHTDFNDACSQIRVATQSTTGRLYIATDDDQEGDVIARDLWRLAIAPENRDRVLRVRLSGVSPQEVQSAFGNAAAFDPMSAATGDARSAIDRHVAALSSDGDLGLVQGSLLLAIAEQKPVVGVVTYMASAADGGAPWVAQQPVLAGAEAFFSGLLDVGLAPGVSIDATVGTRPFNHGEILLSSSLETGASIADVDKAMQALYERGKITFPRSCAQVLNGESARRLAVIAQMNGAAFDAALFTAVRAPSALHKTPHEAPNPLAFDIPLNRVDGRPLTDQVLAHIARNLVDCGVPCRWQKPAPGELKKLPDELVGLRWHRKLDAGFRLYPAVEVQAGFQAWSCEQSLLHFMQANELGRPSTAVEHVNKFTSFGWVDSEFELTAKGRDRYTSARQFFKHKNLGQLVEKYLETHHAAAAEMVTEMVKKFGIPARSNDRMLFDQEYENGQKITL